MRRFVVSASTLVLALALPACADDGGREEASGTGGGGSFTMTGGGEGADAGETTTGTSTTGTPPKLDMPQTTGGDDGSNCGDNECTDEIDLLFVIDNSGSMGEEQLNLARNFPLLVQKLQELEDQRGIPVNAKVQIMVTTTDMGNPLCNQFYNTGCVPGSTGCDANGTRIAERGAPIATNCNARIERFSGWMGTPSLPQVCTSVCPNTTVQPVGDPFIAFQGVLQAENNIPDTAPVDINGDGNPDDEVAQALACVGAQGIDGCGYEAQLESMLNALRPDVAWNMGARPFLRPNALLAIVVITDEVDCSINSTSIFTSDQTWMETNPKTNTKQPSSAVCWNAGVECDPPVGGVYPACRSRATPEFHPIARYIDTLKNLRDSQNKEIVMLGILGVPPVTAHNEEPPYQPTAGGVFDLVYRDWIDGAYPAGDLLPDAVAAMETIADKEFQFGIGPGCTGQDAAGAFTGQAIPPVRVKQVCESLNFVDGEGKEQVRCCIESICDDDFSAAINCLTGIISQSISAPT